MIECGLGSMENYFLAADVFWRVHEGQEKCTTAEGNEAISWLGTIHYTETATAYLRKLMVFRSV